MFKFFEGIDRIICEFYQNGKKNFKKSPKRLLQGQNGKIQT